jgi:uncharacterized protein (TIGR02300 family)
LGKPEFGRKMTCTSCAVRFFDLTRVPAVCPKCGVEQPRAKPRLGPVIRSGGIRWPNHRMPPTHEAVAPEPAASEADPLDEVEADALEAAKDDDAEDIELGNDEDDVPKVKPED